MTDSWLESAAILAPAPYDPIAGSSRGSGDRSDPFPLIGAAVFAWRDIFMGADPRIPPDAFGLLAVFREQNLKTAFTVIARLLPGALPETIGKPAGGEPSSVLGIRPVAGLIQRGSVAFVVFHFQYFPFAAQIRLREMIVR